MRQVRAEFLLKIDGAWIADSALGERATFTRDGFSVRVDLPATKTAFAGLPRTLFPSGAFGSHRSGAGPTGVQEVDIVRVSVSGPLDVRAKELGPPGTKVDPRLMRKIGAFHETTIEIARLTVIEFANRLRTEKGQTWLGFGTAVPEVVGLTSYYDEDGQALRVGFGETPKWHVGHVLAKLGATSRTQALLRAQQVGLV